MIIISQSNSFTSVAGLSKIMNEVPVTEEKRSLSTTTKGARNRTHDLGLKFRRNKG